MAKYRRKLEIVDAVQWVPPDDNRWDYIEGVEVTNLHSGGPPVFVVRTFDVPFAIAAGDWVVTDAAGNKHAYDQKSFENTYELVE